MTLGQRHLMNGMSPFALRRPPSQGLYDTPILLQPQQGCEVNVNRYKRGNRLREGLSPTPGGGEMGVPYDL